MRFSIVTSCATSCVWFRARGGRGHKSGGTRERKGAGGRGKERKQAGTAWFDLDAVFGFGPED